MNTLYTREGNIEDQTLRNYNYWQRFLIYLLLIYSILILAINKKLIIERVGIVKISTPEWSPTSQKIDLCKYNNSYKRKAKNFRSQVPISSFKEYD